MSELPASILLYFSFIIRVLGYKYSDAIAIMLAEMLLITVGR